MKIKNLLLSLLILFISSVAVASQSIKETKSKKSFLWEVKSKTTTIYMLGSIHYFKKEDYPLAPKIEKAFDVCKNVVVEVDVLNINPYEVQIKLMKDGMYSGGDSISKHIEEKTLKMLKTYLKERKYSYTAFSKFKPGLLSINLTALELVRLGYQSNHGIDYYFLKKAKKNKKKILELENMNDQLDLIFNMPNNDLFLQYTLNDMDKMNESMKELVVAWKKGSADEMNKSLLVEPLKETPDLKPIYKKMFDDRNIKMAEKISSYLKTNETYFVIVGSGHLIGDMGIVKLLGDKKMYSITQL